MASLYRVSTADLAPSERLPYWNDLWSKAKRPVAVDAAREGFGGELTQLRAPGIDIISVRSTPLTARATEETRTQPDADTFTLQVMYAGRCQMRHGSARAELATGDIVLVDGSKPYEVNFSVPVHGLVLSLPWLRFKGYAQKLEQLGGHALNVRHGPAAVLSTFIRSAWDFMVERGGGEWPESGGALIWDLLEEILAGESTRCGSDGRAVDLRRRTTALVEGEFSNPAFSSSSIAAGLGISPRYLQRIFAEVGITPSRFLTVRRLEAAAALIHRAEERRSVTEIALACGFNDLSYFSRAFRQRYGRSPSAYRRHLGLPLLYGTDRGARGKDH